MRVMAHVVAVWVSLLDAASQHDPRGVVEIDPEEIAVLQDIDLKAVQDILNAFYAKGMLNEQNRLTAWDKRQHTTSAERVKKHRASKKHDVTPCNTAKRDATRGNAKNSKIAPDTDNRLQIQIQRFRKTELQIQKTEREQRESARGRKQTRCQTRSQSRCCKSGMQKCRANSPKAIAPD